MTKRKGTKSQTMDNKLVRYPRGNMGNPKPQIEKGQAEA